MAPRERFRGSGPGRGDKDGHGHTPRKAAHHPAHDPPGDAVASAADDDEFEAASRREVG